MDNQAYVASLAKLHAVAAVLGISIESFITDTEMAERHAGANECLRLWDKIKTAEDRSRALAYLRKLAEEPI